MARQRHLAHAPIVEAVIDFRVTPSLDERVLDVISSSIGPAIKDRYPVRQEQRAFEGGFGFREGQPVVQPPKDLGLRGYIYKSQDGLQLAQFRRDGFTFNRLKPYTRWASVIAEAKELWKLYVRTASPEFVSRVAVRYINHMSLPLLGTDFQVWLTAPPHVPEQVPQAVSSFLTRIVVHDSERHLDANITQSMEPGPSADLFNIILDIDAYKLGDFHVRTEDLWAILEDLRRLKNTVFFSSITERTAEFFK